MLYRLRIDDMSQLQADLIFIAESYNKAETPSGRIVPHPPRFDPEWCKFRFIRNLYIIPPDTSRLEELSRILQQKVA